MIKKIFGYKELLRRFLSGQIAIQFFNLINGFLLLRWLTIEQQAIFGISFSIQTLLNSLSDLGFTGSIVALTGSSFNDKKTLGNFMASAKYFRKRFFYISLIISVCLVPFFARNISYNKSVVWINLVPIIALVYFQASNSIYESPLLIHKNLKIFYRPQIMGAVLRLLINYMLFVTNILSPFTILSLNAVIILLTGLYYKKQSSVYFDWQAPQKETNKKMFRYISPLLPSVIFNSLFGQIQLFLIAYFGKIINIAQVAALGKLAQIFIFLNAFNLMLLEPLIARSNFIDLPKKMLFFFFVSCGIGCLMILSSYVFPQMYLFILGNKYKNLADQLIWVLAAAAINFISGTLWTMSAARKWVFWWATLSYVVLIMLCQAYGILFFNLSTTQGVLQLSVFTAIVVLVLQSCISIIGFLKEKKLFKYKAVFQIG